MTAGLDRREGQPVLFLGLLLGGWCLLRVLTWQNPWPDFELPPMLPLAHTAFPVPDTGAMGDRRLSEGEAGKLNRSLPDRTAQIVASTAVLPPEPTAPLPDTAAHFDTSRRGVGHNLLFAAGMANLPMPRSVSAALDTHPGSARSIAKAPPAPMASPWRLDAWLLLRDGPAQLAGGGDRPASYGASQLGAILAYRLAPGGAARQPAAYARIARALVDDGDSEAALGLRARLLSGVPLSLHAELRVTERPGRGPEIRPAAFLAGGFDALRLPARMTARGYGQAGYVGGDFATAFADGALVAEREVARFDLATVSLGAGAWGGVQRGAGRFDVGPSVTVKLELGGAPARIEADYRWRVAGGAQPGNGGVVTLSTGF